MKFIHKTFYIFVSIFFIILLLYFILDKQLFYSTITQTIVLWFEKVLPAISISYIISIFLYNYPIISYLLFPIIKHVFHFENTKSCSLFLISILVGNPTSSKLINNAVSNNEISIQEGNRLIGYSSFISSIFIYSLFELYTFIVILILELIVSIILAQLNQHTTYKKIKNIRKQHSLLEIYFEIINFLPILLLSILASMIICNILSIFINLPYLKAIFELTNGIKILIGKTNSFIYSTCLIISHGVAIILQVYWIIKKSSLSFNTFIKYRILAVLIGMISLILIKLFIFFL